MGLWGWKIIPIPTPYPHPWGSPRGFPYPRQPWIAELLVFLYFHVLNKDSHHTYWLHPSMCLDSIRLPWLQFNLHEIQFSLSLMCIQSSFTARIAASLTEITRCDWLARGSFTHQSPHGQRRHAVHASAMIIISVASPLVSLPSPIPGCQPPT